jgi:peptide/nickel transport system permease protein
MGPTLMRIISFVARRLAAAMFTLLMLVALAFVVYWALPSTPASFVYPSAQHLTPYQLQNANHLLGLDRPKIVQYGDYIAHLARGDLGRQWAGAELLPGNKLVQKPVGGLLFPAAGATISIILGGAFLVLLLAVPLGALAGSRVGSWSDRTISIVALIAVCTHPMVLGSVMQKGFADLHLPWPPLGGYCPLFSHASGCGGPTDWAGHLALPWFTFALLFLALYTRMIRVSVAETLHEDFVRTARAKGAGETRVLRVHVLPSATLRVLTMVGMEIGTAIGVCVYIETVYGIGGLGRLSVLAMGGATTSIDLPLTVGIVALITLIVVVGNLIVDVLYAVLDPRAGREPTLNRDKSLAGGVI